MTGRKEISPNRRLELEILAATLEEEGWNQAVAQALLQYKLIELSASLLVDAPRMAEHVSRSAALWLLTCEDLWSMSFGFEVSGMVRQYRKLISL